MTTDMFLGVMNNKDKMLVWVELYSFVGVYMKKKKEEEKDRERERGYKLGGRGRREIELVKIRG